LTALIKSGPMKLSDADTCQGALGTDPDPVALWSCRTAQDIAEFPNSRLKTEFDAANQEIQAGNYSGQHVSKWLPTRQIKTFHPRSIGMAAYRDAIIDAVNQVVASTSPPPPPPPPFASGTCSFHIKETQDCGNDDYNLFANIQLKDNAGTAIGGTSGADPLITASHHLSLGSKLPYTLEVTGEMRGDYVQFSYGGIGWKSTDKNENGNQGWCNQGGWTKDLGCKGADPLMTRVSFSDSTIPRALF